jgi:hypothetical protein
MKKFNFARPFMILVVALASNMIATNLCVAFGMEKEAAGNVGFGVMMVAVLFTFMRLQKNRRRK